MIWTYCPQGETLRHGHLYWPGDPIAPVKSLDNEAELSSFCRKLRDILSRTLPGLPLSSEADLAQLVPPTGYRGARIYDRNTGRGLDIEMMSFDFLNPIHLGEKILLPWHTRAHNLRSITPIRVREGQVLHLAVDADFIRDPLEEELYPHLNFQADLVS